MFVDVRACERRASQNNLVGVVSARNAPDLEYTMMSARPSLAASIAIASLVIAAAFATATTALAQGMPRMQFRTERIIDTRQGGLVLATVSVPVQWRVNSQVLWNYDDVSHPIR